MPKSSEVLEGLAAAAESHALQEHGVAIGVDNVAAADRVLHAESQRLDPQRLEMLSAWYGAWLGRLAVRQAKAEWIGLSEPVAPRLQVRGVLASPIDAVRRRLTQPGAPTLAALVRQLDAWSRPSEETSAANRDAWDRLADDPQFAGAAPLPESPTAALVALDEWLSREGVYGKPLLCLGAGGGRHGPLLARAGAVVTVVDFSERQLDHDRRAAAANGLELRTVCASIDDLRALPSSSFEIVVQPVSSCYVPGVDKVYGEVARVLRPGGLYVMQHKQPASLQTGDDGRMNVASIEGARLPPSSAGHREAGTTEYLHTLEALLGGLCRAGFVIEDLVEPPRGDALAPPGSSGQRAWFLPPYLKVKARRR
ncbi:MAG TPA: class I SAM-dependent methyltransferase [Planctomycetota bacterium]|nr:class I SAM-dependent methyltransferase [Planctomycetota bacterium]